MIDRIIEGSWEEIVAREDLRGHRVRVTVLDEAPKEETREEWLKRFDEWVACRGPVGHFVDDSRESIYSGTLDDPR